jgi:hypothetical protein
LIERACSAVYGTSVVPVWRQVDAAVCLMAAHFNREVAGC